MLADALDSATRGQDASLAASLDTRLTNPRAGNFVDWTAYEMLSSAEDTGGLSASGSSNAVVVRMLLTMATAWQTARTVNFTESSEFRSSLVGVLRNVMSGLGTKIATLLGLDMPTFGITVQRVACGLCDSDSRQSSGLRHVLNDDASSYGDVLPEVKVEVSWNYSSPMGISLMNAMESISNTYSNVFEGDPFSERFLIKSTYMNVWQETISSSPKSGELEFVTEPTEGGGDGFPLWALGIIIPGAIILLLLGFCLYYRVKAPMKVYSHSSV